MSISLDKASEIRVLILKHLRQELTPDDERALKSWQEASDSNREFLASFSDQDLLIEQVKEYYGSRQAAEQRSGSKMPPVINMPPRRKRLYWYMAAAAVLLLLSIGGYRWLTYDNPIQVVQASISPGKDGAILTLSDGTQIILDSAANGKLAEQGKTTIIHKDGQISYQGSNQEPGKILYNTMTTPRGRQYKLKLSDGTAIWLNAASAVTYPTLFAGNKREISVTGEVYLEVAPDKTKPFIVHYSSPNGEGPGGAIEVLGTKFAVNAYSDEAYVKTTLLEGSIGLMAQVNDKDTHTILKPGQQIKVSHENLTLIQHANIEEATAFMNGFFYFDHADIKTVMRQLEKWYDIQVSYTAPVSKRTFDGELERNLPLQVVLSILEKNGVQFSVKGNQVQVQ